MRVISVITFIVISAFHYLSLDGADKILDAFNSAKFSLLALITIYCCVFCYNLLLTPSRIDAEKNKQISDFSERMKNKETLQDAIIHLELAYTKGENICILPQNRDIEPSIAHHSRQAYKKWVEDTQTLLGKLNIPDNHVFDFKHPNPMISNDDNADFSARKLILHGLIIKYKVAHDNT